MRSILQFQHFSVWVRVVATVLSLLAVAFALACTINLAYLRSMSIGHALAGIAVIGLVEYVVARRLGFGLPQALSLVVSAWVLAFTDAISTGGADIMVAGGDVGVPRVVVDLLVTLRDTCWAWISALTLGVVVMVLLYTGWKCGPSGLFVLWAYYSLVPDPVAMVLANAVYDGPADSYSWIDKALWYAPWVHGEEFVTVFAVGMVGYLSHKWYSRRVRPPGGAAADSP